MKTVIDFDLFNVAGLIILTTDEFNPISTAIRSLDSLVHEGIKKGIESIFSTTIPSHSLISCPHSDLIEGIELTWPQIDRPEISEIVLSNYRNHICCLAKPPMIDNLQDEIKKWCSKQLQKQTEYNFIGLFKFLYNKIPNSKNKQYCAEFCSLYIKFLSDLTSSFKVPEKWNVGKDSWEVSPVQIKQWLIDMNWTINKWTKEVPDDYSPIKPIDANLKDEI